MINNNGGILLHIQREDLKINEGHILEELEIVNRMLEKRCFLIEEKQFPSFLYAK